MAGNWKMYKTPAETITFFETFRPLVAKSEHCEVVICPPFTSLGAAVDAAKGSNIRVGAQNVAWAKEGAFTGEVCAPMLKAVGATHAIIGHSECEPLSPVEITNPDTHIHTLGCGVVLDIVHRLLGYPVQHLRCLVRQPCRG